MTTARFITTSLATAIIAALGAQSGFSQTLSTMPAPPVSNGSTTHSFDFNNYTFDFNYQGSDGTLTYRYEPVFPGWGWTNGTFRMLTCYLNGTNFLPSNYGGLSLITDTGEEISPWDSRHTYELLNVREEGNNTGVLVASWEDTVAENGTTNILTYDFRIQMQGRTLVVQVTNVMGISGGIDLNRCDGVSSPVVVDVPYLTLMNVLYTGGNNGTNGVFCSMYFDWENTGASTIYPYDGVYGSQSVYYAQKATYLPRTDGTRNQVNETIYLTVSPSLTDVLPGVPNPVSSYKNLVSDYLVFDNWETTDATTPATTFSDVKAQLQTLHNAGVTNLWVLLHPWQNKGYDDGYPDVLPAKADWGGDSGLADLSQTAGSYGYLFGLHENYVDFYPDAASWNAADCALNSDGTAKYAWFNPLLPIQSYEMKPTRAADYAGYFAPLIHSNYNTTASFLDEVSSFNPSETVDYDATTAGAGTFSETLSQYRNLYGLLRAAHGGPVSGEGDNHLLSVGYIDDVEAQINSGSLSPNGAVTPQGSWMPLLVDFDLLKLHDKTLTHGVGYIERFYADEDNTVHYDKPYSKAQVLEYMATELAYGHGGFICTPGRYVFVDGAYNPNGYVEVAQLEQRYVLPAQRLYANARPTSIRYHDPARNDEISASDYIRRYPATFASQSSSNYMSQVRVIYDNGVVVCVNRHPSQTWQVQLGQPGGWFDFNAAQGKAGYVSQKVGRTRVTSYTLPPTNGWVVFAP